VERELERAELVTVMAERDDRVFSVDTHAALVESLRARLERDGWEVTISLDGPKRRQLPRIERRPGRWRP
jgi:hypothetical protein